MSGLGAVIAARALARRKVQGMRPRNTAAGVGKHSRKGIPVSEYLIQWFRGEIEEG